MEWDDGSFVSLFKATSSLVKKFRVKRFSFRKRLSCRWRLEMGIAFLRMLFLIPSLSTCFLYRNWMNFVSICLKTQWTTDLMSGRSRKWRELGREPQTPCFQTGNSIWRTTPSHATMRGAKEPEETRQDGIRHLLTFFWVVSNYQEKLTLCYLRPWIYLFWHCPANVNLNRHAASRKHIIYRFRL